MSDLPLNEKLLLKRISNMFTNNGYYLLPILIIGIFVIGIIASGYLTTKSKDPVCPDDFKDSKQEIASFTAWVKEFTEKYPNATNSDLAKERRSFYVENNCAEALKRYDDYMARNENEETPKYSQQTTKEAIIYYNKSEEFEKALLLAKEYVALYPNDTEGWVHRGYAYMGLGNCIQASADFYHGSVNGNEEASQLLTYVSNSEICNRK